MERLRTLSTTFISDAANGLYNMDPSIRSLQQGTKIVGPAFTIKLPQGDNFDILRALQQAKSGDVLVIESQNSSLYYAVMGDLYLSIAQTLGIQGVVIDGAIRDVQDTLKLNFPVFCKGTTIASPKKNGGGEMQIPIHCGGVLVNCGDIIVGDDNGVTVVPKDKLEDICYLAKEKQLIDDRNTKYISNGYHEALEFLRTLTENHESEEV